MRRRLARPVGATLAARLAALVLVPLAAGVANAAEAGSASAVIDELHGQLLGVMKEATALGYGGRAERLRPALGRAFDFPFMAERVIGGQWQDMSADERQRWIETFRSLTVATYAGRFHGYAGQRFETLREEPSAAGTVVVRSRVIDPERGEIQLDYRMHQQDGRWQIVDVFMNGTVSELALRRSEYASVLQREGFDSLVASVQRKIADAAAGKLQ